MLSADLADTPLASYRPDLAAECDSVADLLREALEPFIPPEKQRAAFATLDAVLNHCELPDGIDRQQLIVEAFRAAYSDTSHEPSVRIIAAAALKRLGKDGRSYQAMADEFGVTRACVHAHSRRLEKRTGLKCRADKPDSQRLSSARHARTQSRAQRVPASGILRRRRSVFSLFRGL